MSINSLPFATTVIPHQQRWAVLSGGEQQMNTGSCLVKPLAHPAQDSLQQLANSLQGFMQGYVYLGMPGIDALPLS